MSRAEREGSPSLRGNPIPVGAREVRSGRVGLYGRPLVPPNGRRPGGRESVLMYIHKIPNSKIEFASTILFLVAVYVIKSGPTVSSR